MKTYTQFHELLNLRSKGTSLRKQEFSDTKHMKIAGPRSPIIIDYYRFCNLEIAKAMLHELMLKYAV